MLPGRYSFKVRAFNRHTHALAEFPQLIVKALVALYGSILFWVGAWTILDIDTFPRSLQRDLSYTFAGLALMFAADSFYSNAGIDGRCGSRWEMQRSESFTHTRQLLRRLAHRQRFQTGAAPFPPVPLRLASFLTRTRFVHRADVCRVPPFFNTAD